VPLIPWRQHAPPPARKSILTPFPSPFPSTFPDTFSFPKINPATLSTPLSTLSFSTAATGTAHSGNHLLAMPLHSFKERRVDSAAHEARAIVDDE
jgi:hypothetical protein